MDSPRRIARPVLAAALCLGPLAASAQTPPPALREDLDAVAAALDRAVRQVSRPGGFAIAGSATRAYVLPGMGAVFVLAPRALPVRRARQVDGPTARALSEAAANLQESLRRASSPELRAQIERSLEAVRQAQVALRGGALAVPRPVWGGPIPVPDLGPEIEAAVAAQAAAAQQQMQRFDEQWAIEMQILGAQTDAFRQEALRMQRDAEHALQEQLRAWPELGVPVVARPPDPVEAPEAPAPPGQPGAPAAPAPAAVVPAPDVIAAPAVPPAPAAPPLPPWSLWFEPTDVPDAADADAAVHGVREAVLGILATQTRRLSHVAPEESVVVAVDFLARGVPPGARSRTLVLRIRKKDLEERQAGRLAAEEFERRVQAAEY